MLRGGLSRRFISSHDCLIASRYFDSPFFKVEITDLYRTGMVAWYPQMVCSVYTVQYYNVRLVMHVKKTKRRDNGTRTELDAS